MTVIATPIPPVIQPGVSCTDQGIAAPTTTLVEGTPALAKLQAIEVKQGQQSEIHWTMKSLIGDTVDLTACADATLKVRIREVTQLDSNQNPGVELPVTVIDPTGGLVKFTLDSDTVAFPGISNAEIAVLDTNSNVVFTNTFYLIVNRGQWAAQSTNLGPPTMAEIRLHLRDSDPADNLWLGVTEFDSAEIAACIERPIHYFNDSQPPLNTFYSTANFPWRYYFLEGIIGCLYQMASLHYARTHLAYQQQGGLMVDDKNKYEQYDAIGKAKWDSYKDWVLRKKVNINALGAIQTFGSPYYGGIWRGDGGL